MTHAPNLSALLASRIHKRLDDDFPLFTETLLDVLYPHYLRPFPSCAIAHFNVADAAGQMSKAAVLPRGTVLKSRTISVYVAGFKTKLKATQLVYRSTDALMRPAANVTTIFTPDCATASCTNKNKVISYQSFYDSLNPDYGPSRAYSGGKRLPDLLPAVETILFGKYVKQGYTVVVSDTEGQKANFAAGPEYGYNTLGELNKTTAWRTTSGSAKTITDFTYTLRGLTETATTVGGSRTQYSYDAFGNVREVKVSAVDLSLPRTSKTVTDNDGLARFAIDAAGGVTEQRFDTAGRVVARLAQL